MASAAACADPKEKELTDRNMVYMGTAIQEGQGMVSDEAPELRHQTLVVGC